MKIRKGFVSNSSSSSFVVAFPSIPESVEDVKKILFDDDQRFYTSMYHDDAWTLDEVAEIVFNDIKEQTPNDFKQIHEAIDCGWFDERPDYERFKDVDGNVNWDKYEKASENVSKDLAQDFVKQNEGKHIYTFHYSDNVSILGSAMEHGPLFDNLEHKRISCH